MQTIGATEARANFTELLRRVSENGESILIGGRGKPRALMVPVDDFERIETAGEKAPRESDAWLRAIMDHAPIDIYLKDSEGRYAQINRHYEKTWGIKNAEIRGKLPGDVHQKDHAKVSSAHDIAVLESGEVIAREDNVQLESGIRSLHMIKFPVRNAAGEIAGLGGIAIDFTGRKRVEEELRKTDALYRGTERLARLGHWEWDEIEDHCVYCSEELALIHGVTVEEFLERASSFEADLDWIHPEDRERYNQVITKAAQRRKGIEIEYRLLQANGNVLDVREVSEPVLDQQGTLIRSIGFVQDVSKRKRAEQALRESEERFRGVFDLGVVGVAILSPAGHFQQVNSAYCSFLGYGKDELIGEHFSQVIHPDDLESVTERLRQLLAGDVEGYHHDRRYRHKEGHEVWGTAGLFVLHEPDGTPRNFVVQVQDITERKQIEVKLRQARDELEQRVAERTAELRQSEARLKAIMDHAPVEIGLKDAEGRYILVSREFEKRYCLKSEGVGGKFPGDFFAPEVAEPVAAHDNDVFNSGQVIEREMYEVIDGKIRTCLAVKFPVRDRNQRIFGVGGVAIDITERKRVEEELRESEKRYRELFDDSPVAIWEEDWSAIRQELDDLARSGVDDWRGFFNRHRDQLGKLYDMVEIVEISLAAIDLYRDESKEELLRRSAAAFVIDEELDAFREIVLAFLAGRMTVDITAKDVAGDGIEIVVRRRVVVPPRYRDDWSRIIYAMEDVTESTRTEEQLRQAHRMEAVGQLTGGVAHDFNNLLAIIMGNAELLEDRFGNGDDSLNAINRAATRGAELTQRLLAFSRRQSLRPQVVDLGTLDTEMGELLRRTLGETIAVEITSEPELWQSRIDPGQLENAILNLALNARDAMREGGALHIESTNATLDGTSATSNVEVSPGDYVLITVSDSGVGMSAEIQTHALEPFFTTKDVGEGSGLGLPMAYGFAKQSGGDLVISSEEGLGTTIKLYLPRTTDSDGPAVPRAMTEMPRGQGEIVLVVEDELEVCLLAEAILKSLGYQVLTARDGREGLGILDEEPRVDLLLSDVVLTGTMSGPDLTNEASSRFNNLKVLFMSGYADGIIHHHSPLPEGADVLNKPFRRLELAQMVRTVLDR